MSAQDTTPRDALMRLGASTAEAIAQVLEMFAPGTVERGDVTVLAESATPFSSLPRGAVAASVSYVDGVTGANIFVLAPAGVRKMAIAMGVPAPEPDELDEGQRLGPIELTELELSAIGEAANQMMAAAAGAIGVVLGQEIEISPPEIRVLDDPSTAAEFYGTSPHATSTTFLIDGEACRLIQLVPAAFVVRVARAFDELGSEQDDGEEAGHARHDSVGFTDEGATSMGLVDALGEIKLRVWAELGRTHLPLGQALGLPLGAVVELDRAADAPVDLFVNGVRFAQGHLLTTDDGEWALALDEVGGRRLPDQPVLQAQTSITPEIQGAAI